MENVYFDEFPTRPHGEWNPRRLKEGTIYPYLSLPTHNPIYCDIEEAMQASDILVLTDCNADIRWSVCFVSGKGK